MRINPISRRYRGRVHRALRLLVAGLSMGLMAVCSPEESIDTYMTATAARQKYTAKVSVEGELDAKVAKTLVVPRFRTWNQPTVAFLVKEGTFVQKDSVVAALESNELVIEYRNAVDELAIARAEAEQKTADLKLQRLMLESEMRRLEAAAATARLQLPRLAFAAPRMREIQELEMKKAELEAEKIRKKLASLEGIEKEEITHFTLKIRQAQDKLTAAETTLNGLILRAPADGIVVRMTNWSTGNKIQEGESLYPGWPVAKIPDLGVMQVNAQVSETEAKRLKTGQQAEVTIPSLNNLTLPGHVSSVANMAKPIRRDSQVKRVDIVVEIDSTHADLVPGLTAACRIVIEESQSALVVPMDCVFEQDSLKVVYVREGARFVPHTVTVAQQGADFAVITDGIEEHAVLALRQPSAGLVKKNRDE
jgi:multidrug resistance efflux pump